MGNETSKTEVNRQLHEAVNNARNRASTGDLQRSSGKNNNPPYQNPLQFGHSRPQRNFKAVKGKRVSAYDELDSPEKQPAKPSAITGKRGEFSPTKRQRGNKKRDEVVAREVRRSPRKSQKSGLGLEDDAVESAQDGNDTIVAGVVEMATTVHEDDDGSKLGHGTGSEAAVGAQGPERGQPSRSKGKLAHSGFAQKPSAQGRTTREAAETGTTRVSGAQHGLQTRAQLRAQAEADMNPADAKKNRSLAMAEVEEVVNDIFEVPTPRKVSAPSNKKRKGGQTSTNIRAKRAKVESSAADEDGESGNEYDDQSDQDDEDGQDTREIAGTEAITQNEAQSVDRLRWFGQYGTLKKVFNAVNKIGQTGRGRGAMFVADPEKELPLRPHDAKVKPVLPLCKKATGTYTRLRCRSSEATVEDDIAQIWGTIATKVDELAGKGVKVDETNVTRCYDIYVHLVPRLLEVLETALACYETMDKEREDVQGGQITITHLEIVNGIIKTIVDLIKGAQNYKRPKTTSRIFLPIRENIKPPLERVHSAFSTCILEHHLGVRDMRRRQSDARHATLKLEQEQRLSRQEERITRCRDKWHRLHAERRIAEGGIPTTKKLIHLELPRYDIDHNGNKFERAQIFHPRTGPPPGLVDLASKEVWKQLELSALADGLREYAGPLVLERVIRKYCGRSGELNRFNVTQIATVAAMMREVLVQQATDASEEVPTWVKGIPVWTKMMHPLGKENEEEEVELGAEEGGDDVEVVEEGLFVQ